VSQHPHRGDYQGCGSVVIASEGIGKTSPTFPERVGGTVTFTLSGKGLTCHWTDNIEQNVGILSKG
jgi:hypothetical protein